VRGTKFLVNVDDQGNTKIAVNEGRVAVTPVVKAFDNAEEKGLCDQKTADIMKQEVVKPVDVNPGEEVSLDTTKVQALDKSVEKAVDNLAEKQEGKKITEDT